MKLSPPAVFISVVFLIQHFCFLVTSSAVPSASVKLLEERYANETTEAPTTFGPLHEADTTAKAIIFIASKPFNKSEESAAAEESNQNEAAPPEEEVEMTVDELLNCEYNTNPVSYSNVTLKGMWKNKVPDLVLAGDKKEPLIVRPKEHEDVATLLVPLTDNERDEIIRCPFCGKSQHVHLNPLTIRNEPCMHCTRCGHALQFKEGELPKKSARLVDVESENDLNITSSAFPKPPKPSTVVEVANLNLTRKDLLRRRLNYQRVHDYLKSIEPKRNQRSSITMAHTPVYNYYGKTSRTSSYPRPKGQAKSSSRSIWSWLFGNDKNGNNDKPVAAEEVKIDPEIRSPLTFQQQQQYYQTPSSFAPHGNYNSAPQSSSNSGYRCPFMTYQTQRKRK